MLTAASDRTLYVMEAKVFSVIHDLLTSVSQTVGSPAQEPSELVKTLLEERASIRKQLEEVGVQISKASQSNDSSAEVITLQAKIAELQEEIRQMKKEREQALEVAKNYESCAHEDVCLRVAQTELELSKVRESMKKERKQFRELKNQKETLLDQLRELYSKLNDKDKELNTIAGNYQQLIKDGEEKIKELALENRKLERERWDLMKMARDTSERSVTMRSQFEEKLQSLQVELDKVKGDTEKEHLGMAESMPGGLNMGNVETLSSGSSSLDKKKNADRNSIDGYSDEHIPVTTLPKMENVTLSATAHSDHSPSEHNGFTMSSSSSHDAGSPPPDSNSGATLNMEKKNKKKLSIGGSFTKFWKGNKKVKDNGELVPVMPILTGEDNLLPMNKSITAELQEQWAILNEVWGTPMAQWKGVAVAAWMEAAIGMSQYAQACRENIKSGRMLLECSSSDLEKSLGITNPIHKRKLRLALEDHKGPNFCKFPQAGALHHIWVAKTWAVDIGLPQLADTLLINLVDGRVLNSLTKEDLRKYLKINRKIEQLSFLSGVELLRMHEFNKEAVLEQRDSKDGTNNLLYWTNRKIKQWLNQIDLQEYSENLSGSGVHGALLVLEQNSFTSDSLATILNIPTSAPLVRKHLATELTLLLSGRADEGISMMKPVRASTVGASFGSVRSSAHRVDNPHLAAIDLGDREAKTRWSFRESAASVGSASKLTSSLEHHTSSTSLKKPLHYTHSSNGRPLRVSLDHHHTGTGTTV